MCHSTNHVLGSKQKKRTETENREVKQTTVIDTLQVKANRGGYTISLSMTIVILSQSGLVTLIKCVILQTMYQE